MREKEIKPPFSPGISQCKKGLEKKKRRGDLLCKLVFFSSTQNKRTSAGKENKIERTSATLAIIDQILLLQGVFRFRIRVVRRGSQEKKMNPDSRNWKTNEFLTRWPNGGRVSRSRMRRRRTPAIKRRP